MGIAHLSAMPNTIPYDLARPWLRQLAEELKLEPANIARQAGFSTTALTNCYYSKVGDARSIKLKTLRAVARKFKKPLGDLDPSGDEPTPPDALTVAIELVNALFGDADIPPARRAQAIREAQAILARHLRS